MFVPVAVKRDEEQPNKKGSRLQEKLLRIVNRLPKWFFGDLVSILSKIMIRFYQTEMMRFDCTGNHFVIINANESSWS